MTRSPVGHVDLSIRALTSLDACSLTISISSNFSRGFAFVYSFIVPYKEGYIRWNRDGSFRFVEIKSTANMFNSTAHVTPRSIGKSSFSIYRQCKTSNNLIDNFFFLFFSNKYLSLADKNVELIEIIRKKIGDSNSYNSIIRYAD